MIQKSQNGWVASQSQNEIDIKHFPVEGTAVKGSPARKAVANRKAVAAIKGKAAIRFRCTKIAGPILAAFAAEFHKLVEPLNVGTFDDWSYAFRGVRGSEATLSNHASGTALDLNAVNHPLGKAGTFKPKQVVIIKQLCKKYHLVWGGSYKGRKDEMHFEVTETPAQVKALTKSLKL